MNFLSFRSIFFAFFLVFSQSQSIFMALPEQCTPVKQKIARQSTSPIATKPRNFCKEFITYASQGTTESLTQLKNVMRDFVELIPYDLRRFVKPESKYYYRAEYNMEFYKSLMYLIPLIIAHDGGVNAYPLSDGNLYIPIKSQNGFNYVFIFRALQKGSADVGICPYSFQSDFEQNIIMVMIDLIVDEKEDTQDSIDLSVDIKGFCNTPNNPFPFTPQNIAHQERIMSKWVLSECFYNNDSDKLQQFFEYLYNIIPANIHVNLERYYQMIFYCFMAFGGTSINLIESHTGHGRADVIIETNRGIWIIEFKRNGSVSNALSQAKLYAPAFNRGKSIHLTAVNVDTEHPKPGAPVSVTTKNRGYTHPDSSPFKIPKQSDIFA